MRRASPAVLAAILAGVATLTVCAAAQSVPVPKPSPQYKRGEAPRPPLSLGPPPSLPNPVPPGKTPASTAGTNGAVTFDAKQRALIDKVSAYLTGIQSM